MIAQQLLHQYGYLAIAAVVALEDFGLPLPGETILIAGAVAAGTGRLNIVAVALVGFAAAVLGDNVGFAIGHFGGRRLVLRWGRRVWITPERFDRAHAFMKRRGPIVIVVARFFEGLRQLNGIIAGTLSMHWARFLSFNVLGAALWVGVWSGAGYFAGRHVETVHRVFRQYEAYFLAALAVAALFALGVHLYRVRRAAA